MATVITAGNATNGLSLTADNTGSLDIKTGTGSGTTAISISSSQIATFTAAPIGAGMLTSGTSVSATGTSVNFTDIPSWVKRITVMFSGVSTSGTSLKQVQLGAGAITTSGYSGGYGGGGAAAWNGGAISSGVALGNSAVAADTLSGVMLITNVTGNTWALSYSGGSSSGNFAQIAGGSIALGGTLDRLRITTVNGTDTFDAGSINILYE